jgi:hypothetical protein
MKALFIVVVSVDILRHDVDAQQQVAQSPHGSPHPRDSLYFRFLKYFLVLFFQRDFYRHRPDSTELRLQQRKKILVARQPASDSLPGLSTNP